MILQPEQYFPHCRHFLVGEILYAKVQRWTVAKYRCANGSRIFTTAFRKSQIWDFEKLDLQRCEILDIEGGKAYSVKAYSKAMKRNIKVVVHYPESGGHKIYFSTDLDMSAKDIIEYYRTRFQIEFCFRDSKQFTGLNDCQARDLRKLDFAFNASLASVNAAKVMRQRYYPSLSIGLLKAYLSNIYMLKRIFSKSGLKPNRTFNTKLIKELFGIVAEAA